tara:strand:+ start:44620 stop:44769 length:150 start_codon:yes stop_codon:yes gene_type:complete
MLKEKKLKIKDAAFKKMIALKNCGNIFLRKILVFFSSRFLKTVIATIED